jgi:hypothetical protein
MKKTLNLVYFAYFHCILSYGIIFWGNSTDGKKLLCVQKEIFRVMADIKTGVPYKELFKKFRTLPLAREFLL